MLRKFALAAVAAALVVPAASPSPARAQMAVYCGNCSTVWTQLVDSASQAEDLVNQASQLAQQVQQYQTMLQNTAQLPQHVFGDAMQDIRRINNIVNQAKGIAYTASNLDSQFQLKFKGLSGYQAGGMDGETYASKYAQWSQDTNDSALNTLRVLKAQSDGFEDEDALMQQLQDQAGSADGQMKAMSVGNELAIQQVSQLQKLRQLIMAQSAMQAQALATQQDRDDANKAAADAFFKTRSAEYGGQTY